MKKIWYGYSGTEWEEREFCNFESAFDFLETLRPANNRPSHIILKNFLENEINLVIEILYAPQILYFKGNKLCGGLSYTRKYLSRTLFKCECCEDNKKF